MTNVYDAAHELARALKDSDEYKKFVALDKQVKGNESLKAMMDQSNLVEDTIKKLRLWQEGSIKVPVQVYYSVKNNQPCTEYMTMEGQHGANRLYQVNESETSEINGFLKRKYCRHNPVYSLQKHIHNYNNPVLTT